MNADALIGTWFLREAYAVGPRGERLHDVYGARPAGVIHYGGDARMMALITHEGRAQLDGDRQAAPQSQRAEAYRSSIAYAGGFDVEGGWVRHAVDMSTYPNWVGTVLRRALSFEQDAAVLTTAPQMQDGIETVIKLVWQRQPVEH
ncbi:lipocalin-like domain-containing protein [Variovorax sp. NFACC27]|uniref:lipocalin-like domain-containing protein n=1 Tax=unclassified Variovorax TaxID=663243 RepID=UPI00089C44AE|nr:lipocalin-like domain-containing protein [Variovorax sp. YR750]SEF35133.1 Lipocalin-like domain-containing protein [Variovorax sp. NFACC28]SEG98675.1 Lipocalin-like domain-containing protein [Variovorax sp. NFACC29]SFE12910.1 Lipocalin-like domain-containing protein [Variovorax sp. NFACC26]SFH18552.1 Lipocalin-like domain-containing protein [Variovorax sp. NFACC27]SEM41270.1 Lipocalin-like domain-containing protein [Variovorax sp. YR750]